MPKLTYYEVLGVKRSASFATIDVAYRSIIDSNHPNKTCFLGPFARAQAEKLCRDASEAWNTLSDFKKRSEYDRTIPGLGNEPTETEFGNSNWNSEEPMDIEDPQYRYMNSSSGTEVQVVICNWRLAFNISPRFRFLNNLSELSKREKDAKLVSFEIGLERDPLSKEYRDPSLIELAIKVTHIPKGLQVASIKSLFKETNANTASATPCCTLILTVISEPCPSPRFAKSPWSYSFNFDYNERIRANSRGTHLIFTRNEPPQQLKQDHDLCDSLELDLSRDKDVNANAFLDMKAERCLKLTQMGVTMWRLAAVGFKKAKWSQ